MVMTMAKDVAHNHGNASVPQFLAVFLAWISAIAILIASAASILYA
jgi:hypothetical protein